MPRQRRLAAGLVFAAAFAGLAGRGPARAEPAAAYAVDIPAGAPLRLVSRTPMPQMKGTWDHLTADPATARLFLTAQDEHAVDVLDVAHHELIVRIIGHFSRPQGQLFIPQMKRLVVSNGADGTVRFIETDSYRLVGTVQLSKGADLMSYEPATHRLYVESGGVDSNRGPGHIAVIDAANAKIIGDIPTTYRPAAMVLDPAAHHIYVLIPAQKQVAVIDTRTDGVVSHFNVPGRPGFVALDSRDHRLFVVTRTHDAEQTPPSFNVLDSDSGRLIQSLPAVDDASGMHYDARRCRIYTTSLRGQLQAFGQDDRDHYETLATLGTGFHSGTSEFLPQMNRLFVAVAQHDEHPGEVLELEPQGPVRSSCR